MTIQELADRAGVTTRTIRYYVEQGVLPPPGHGRPAEYSEEHVQRLALIKRLKEQYLPLEEIRDTMQRLDLSQVETLVAQYAPPQQETARQKLSSAADYIAGVLGRGVARDEIKRLAEPSVHPAYAPPGAARAPSLSPSPSPLQVPAPVEAAVEAPAATSPPGSTYIGSPAQSEGHAPAPQGGAPGPLPSRWERVQLADGVELHYAVEADSGLRRKLALLVETARRILGNSPGNGE